MHMVQETNDTTIFCPKVINMDIVPATKGPKKLLPKVIGMHMVAEENATALKHLELINNQPIAVNKETIAIIQDLKFLTEPHLLIFLSDDIETI